MRRTYLSFFAAFVVPAALYACANDDDTPPGPKRIAAPGNDAATVDGGGGVDAASEAAADAPVDAAKDPVRCMQAELDTGNMTTAAAVTIAFPTAAGPAQYTNNCIKVKVGTKVTFAGSFALHPLEPNGGDVPTPIPAQQTSGTTLDITMSSAGTFGYECNFHPGTMFGAIQVVP